MTKRIAADADPAHTDAGGLRFGWQQPVEVRHRLPDRPTLSPGRGEKEGRAEDDEEDHASPDTPSPRPGGRRTG